MNKSSDKTSSKVFVLDASAIYNGILTHNLVGMKYLPDCVVDEIKGMLRGEAIIEEALLYDDVKIASPEPESINKIKDIAQKTGDIQELSDCDIAVLALGSSIYSENNQMRIISDDYDIQNLAKHIGLPYRGIQWKGITHTHEYLWICTGCGIISKDKIDTCIECGSEVKKKTQRKKIGKSER